MNIGRAARLSMANIASTKPQKVTTSEINNLRTRLEGVKNTSGGLGNGAFTSDNTKTLSELKTNIISSQTRLVGQKTSIFANKKGQLKDLLKEINSLSKKMPAPQIESNNTFNKLEMKAIKTQDNNKSHNPTISRTIGLNTNISSHRQFNN
ncbi:hypothetical protein [Yersinia artesiana]|uniref:hypothetical protein n=1 Tax=Yersinia artesiana TaxID=2890315 RepID=UPI0015821072|nr:hypothetical protein [Yersinia artesiana]